LVMPTLAHSLHTPASAHEVPLSVAGAIVLLMLFFASVLFSLQGGHLAEPVPEAEHEEKRWPMWRVLSVLVIAGASAAFVSDWFVEALSPATESLGISQAFAGLVLVAIAGNAVENMVGIRLAIKNKMNYAISIILNSSLQIAFALTPVLVLLSSRRSWSLHWH
jgi:Ca2+:H+ antiporter